MSTITPTAIKELADVHGARCASIYLPTHRVGRPVLEKEDQTRYRNLLQDLRKQLGERGFDEVTTEDFLRPLQELGETPDFWHHQLHGLAVFHADDYTRTLQLPFSPETQVLLSHEFYLKPLLPLLSGDGAFFLLALGLEAPMFYAGTRAGLTPVQLPEEMPREVSDALVDVQETDYTGRHGQRAGRQAQSQVHGQGGAKEVRKDTIRAYFRQIDKHLAPSLQGESAPLLLAGLDHLVALYREVNTYPYLYPEVLSGNPSSRTIEELHRAAWQIMAFHFDEPRQAKVEDLRNHQMTEKTEFALDKVIPAAFAGQVDSLFLDMQATQWGIYDPHTQTVHLHDEHHTSNTDLLNLLAITVIRQGGQVFPCTDQTLPVPPGPVNALYRYA